MYYRLVALSPLDQLDQTSWTLHLPATIGRSPEHEVSINHESISRTHCRLSLGGDGALTVRDLGSTNGTYVDDNKVERSVLKPGAMLQLGAISFRVEYVTELMDDDKSTDKPRTYDLSTTVPMQKLDPETPPSQPSPKKWWSFWKS